MEKFIDSSIPISEPRVRIKAFDVLKFFAIFLVLWGHSLQYLLSSNYYDEPVYRIIYSFHMPLFMMVSGYFSHSSMKLSLLGLTKKKFIQLILPSFSWGVVLGIWLLFFNTDFLTQNSSLRLISIKETVVKILNGFFDPYSFWFLKTCFFCYLLAYCGSHLRIKKTAWICITIFLSQGIPYVVNIGIMYPCFVLGMELKDNQKFYAHIIKYKFLLLCMFFLMLCFWDQFFWTYDGVIRNFIINYMHISNSYIFAVVARIYKIIIGIIGSLAFIGLICSLIPQEKNNKLISLCCDWGQYTLGIYLLQSLVLEVIMSKYIILNDFNFYVVNFLITPIISLIVLSLCIYTIRIMSKSSMLALLFYGKSDAKR